MHPKRQALIERLLESSRSFGRMMWAGRQGCFKRFNLHPAQVRILYFVQHRGSVTMKEIAESMDATGGAATQLVEGVVRAGLLERSVEREDRRKVHIVLSHKGEKKFAQFRKDHLAWVAKLLSPLSDRELEQLIAVQKKVMARAAKSL